jgi:hypothetical protein
MEWTRDISFVAFSAIFLVIALIFSLFFVLLFSGVSNSYDDSSSIFFSTHESCHV